MAVSTPTLGGYTLPVPSGYEEVGGYRGGSVQLASGGIHFDVVDSTYKRTWLLTWRGLTAAQKSTILAAYAAIKTGAVAFAGPDGAAANVTRSPGQTDLVWAAKATPAGTWLWETTMELREV